tara:strand:- start:14301 stop:15236 length:936 start_codon:yes stop_codon:yes gene_type:complete
MPSDYGDVTLSNSSVTTNVYQSQERVGITGSDGVIIGVGGAFPVTDNGGSLTVDFDRPVPVTDNDGSLTVDGLIGITGQPIHTTGTIKLDEPIEIYGDVRAAQSGDWFVAITGQPVWVTGNFATESVREVMLTGINQVGITGTPEVVIKSGSIKIENISEISTPPVTVVGVSGYQTFIIEDSGVDAAGEPWTSGIGGHRYTTGENYVSSGIFIKPYTLHSYHVVQTDPNIGPDGAIFVIETTNFDDKHYYPVYAAKIDQFGTTMLPDPFGWGGDGLTGGFHYRDQWNFKFARFVIQNYTSGTFYISQHHTP